MPREVRICGVGRGYRSCAVRRAVRGGLLNGGHRTLHPVHQSGRALTSSPSLIVTQTRSQTHGWTFLHQSHVSPSIPASSCCAVACNNLVHPRPPRPHPRPPVSVKAVVAPAVDDQSLVYIFVKFEVAPVHCHVCCHHTSHVVSFFQRMRFPS